MKSFYQENANPDDFYHAYYHRESTDWDTLYKDYNAGVDWPTVTFYKELLTKYPHAKVILTVRSPDSWFNSVRNTLHRHSLRADKIDPGHPTYRVARMINTFLFEGLIGDTDRFEQNEEQIKQMFIDHNEEVKRFVPKDQLLVLELGEGWEKLCAFLGKEVPNTPYPNLNSTQDFQENIAKHRKNLAVVDSSTKGQPQKEDTNPSDTSASTKTEIPDDNNSNHRLRGKFAVFFFGKKNKNAVLVSNDNAAEKSRGKINSDRGMKRFFKDAKAKLFAKAS